MTPAIEESRRYLRLADEDAAAFRALQKLPEIKFRLACFHAQQAVEKCMKAVMFGRGILFPPIHDLVRLARVLQEHNMVTPCSEDELRKLNPFAVTFRYDDTDIPLISPAEVERMVAAVRRWAGDVVEKNHD